MTNLKKLGLSALAGSLVAVSAQAGEIAVTGSANVTYVTGEKVNGGKTIGTDRDVAFTGTGEMDNGWTFKVSTLLTDAYSVSSSFTSLTMGSLGTVSFGTDTGGASYKYDEEVPQAYEQISDAQQTSANIVGNQMDSNSIVYNSPSFDIAGASISLDAEFSPNANGVGSGDGGTTSKVTATNADGNLGNYGKGYGLGATIKYAGLTAGAYGTERENRDPTTGSAKVRDAFEGVWYAKYSVGPVAFGYSESYLDSGKNAAGGDNAATAKVVRVASGIFEGEQFSVAFNVNENLSVSYTDSSDVYDEQSNATTDTADVSMDTKAIQVAYSMGAMSVKAYQMSTKNPGYDNDAADRDVTEIALGLAF
ncbi:porin [Candidatus Pelagibacter sp. Uisw_121]|uniref:porin n=1 Tax=Candidatus Pelagibacter sp. Uisw_121 TaxID=3230987 RepID=UPI0039ED6D09